MDNVTNALGNVLLAQNDDQELLDVDGNPVTVTATKLAEAKVEGAFDALQYQTLQPENNAVVPINTGNNVFLIEDDQNELLSYGVVAQNYFSTDPDRAVMLIYNKEGQLVPGLELINADDLAPVDAEAKTVVVRHPSNPSEYLLFYRDQQSGLHCATLRNSGGLEITKHQGFAYSGYGRHMAVIQDQKNKEAYLYATTHVGAVLADDGTITTAAGTNLVRFSMDKAGVVSFDGTLLPQDFASFDTHGDGELQIALDGSAISVYHNTSLPAQWTAAANAEIRTWPLDKETLLPVVDEVAVIAVPNGNIGKGSLVNTGTEIYYTQYTQEVVTSTDTKVVKRASDQQIVTTNGLGDLRVNTANNLYQFIQMTDSGQEWNLDTGTVTTLNNLPASANGATGYQPYQPYTILQDAAAPTEGIVYRTVGDKYYELKDHLGNVRVVVDDRKKLDVANGDLSANVVSYNNYYAFGMLQPNRHKDSKSYRYGFNGMEADNEIKGEGNSYDFGARMLDPRIGRFFSADKAFRRLPFITPYNYVNNNPTRFIDPDGNFLIDVHKRNMRMAFRKRGIKKGTSKETQSKIMSYRMAIVGYYMLDGSVVAPDKRALPWPIGGGADASVHTQHFDSMLYKEVIDNFNNIYTNIDGVLDQYEKGLMDSEELGIQIGESFHAIQDFYSHSNYIEIYEELYGQTDLNEIPTIEEAMSSKKYSRFAELLKEKLYTGEYPGEGERSHKGTNHDLGKGSVWGFLEEVADKEVNWNSKAAETVAGKATTELNNKVESKIK